MSSSEEKKKILKENSQVSTMSSSEETDFSESELDEASAEPYKALVEGRVALVFNEAENGYRCPFCPNKKRRYYSYRVLLGHAYGVANGSVKRRVKEKANHYALEKFLKVNEITYNY